MRTIYDLFLTFQVFHALAVVILLPHSLLTFQASVQTYDQNSPGLEEIQVLTNVDRQGDEKRLSP
ncbi:hypothetical protein MsedC_1168 [Metallosphaera sedula]|uniref:Uncharacterized protein n=2 Tax=Metallosphaera TaxID=41980 RepID=A0A0K1SVK5_9CREN|nr:hypothetical protein MsedA_1168 [Metallosphaera sedula]QCO29198.1 hypothetical protein DFR88_00760 [Metallosphaera prunae]AKV76423.1 hypothetical protein MsedB_1170 [Metallosphaera sedula]AKV78675.1 hypothetical protein MsedC_1168 [Metallosphaera sedula]AKV80920.1 hypothetical protein MsedD_1169 [Metallosphaera sedula]